MEKTTLPVGVSVLLVRDGMVLLGRRINNTASGLLSTPGGRVEHDEDIYQCAVREVKEETNLNIVRDAVRVIAFREHFRYNQHYVIFYVCVRNFSIGGLTNVEPDKCSGWEWHDLSQQIVACTEPDEILRLVRFDRTEIVQGGVKIVAKQRSLPK